MQKTLLVCLFALFFVGSAVFPSAARAGVNATPSSLNFGSVTVGTVSGTGTFQITNPSGRSVSIVSVYSNTPQFVVVSPAMPVSLASRNSLSIQVMFQPNAAGTFSGSVIVTAQNTKGGGSSTALVSVSGTAVGAAQALSYLLSGSASSLSFSNTLIGTSASQGLTLTNSGTGTLTISQATISGTGFTLSGYSGSVSLAAGYSLPLTVSFAPIAAGTVSGSLTVVSNATNSPAVISLSGTGVQPLISVVPSSISFSNVSVGTTNTQTLSIRNTGTANLTISQASLAGSTFSYSSLALPLTLAPGASSNLTVAFTPTSASNFYANLSLANNSPTTPLVVPISGTSVAPVLQLSASPTSLSFGSITTGTTSSQTVTLTNTGNSSVSISSIGITGTGFTPAGFTLPLSLAAGQSTAFSVVFAPTTAGTLSGTATVVSNASNSPTTVALSGTGTTPLSHTVALNWTPSSTSFAGFNVYRGSQSGGPYTKVNTSLIASTSYADTTVTSGSTYYYVATEEDTSGVESAYSSEASAIIP